MTTHEELKKNLSSKEKWLRALYMLLFIVIFTVARFIVWIVIAVQFLMTLFTNKLHKKTLDFSAHLNTYIYQILNFLTYNSEIKPYPFTAWPGEKGEHKS